MKTLAIDTSTSTATAAIIEDGNMIGVVSVNMNKPHSQKIMPVAESLFKQVELSPKDIDLYAAAKGPGSFTGLRIGIAAVLGFSDAVNVPCIGVSTLDAMAFPFENADDYVCPLIDAKRNRAYYAVYKNGKRVIEPDCTSMDEILEKCKTLDGKVIFTGDFVPSNKEVLKSLGDKAVITDDAFCQANAIGVARLAEKMYKAGVCERITPDYVLKSYVEELDK